MNQRRPPGWPHRTINLSAQQCNLSAPSLQPAIKTSTSNVVVDHSGAAIVDHRNEPVTT